jgi:ABC-type transport system involved in multi-copper enzyme maturation permease subunit
MDNKPQRKLIYTERIPAILVILLSLIGGPFVFYWGGTTQHFLAEWLGIAILCGGMVLGLFMFFLTMQKTRSTNQRGTQEMP